jgi:hypothetical protein
MGIKEHKFNIHVTAVLVKYLDLYFVKYEIKLVI